MSLKTQYFEFGEFLLDLEEKVLLHDNRPLAITPKAFLLLRTLIENRGHIVEKDQLMKSVWADSFVEQGNLSFTVNLLRKALGDDSHSPRFIETVPRRGYRFIANVSEKGKLNGSASHAGILNQRESAISNRTVSILLASVLIVLIVAVGLGSWYASTRGQEPNAAVLTSPFNSEKLSTDGKVRHAVISPDGANVIYVSGKDKQSVWLRQLESGSNVEIIPPSDDFYYGLAFSPDGNSIYFVRRPEGDGGKAYVYRISVFGGVPTRITDETQGWISISPDGRKLSFVRCPNRESESCSLWIADASDGKNERKLVSRPSPFRIGDNKISPDGKSIAFAVGQSRTGANEFGLAEVNIESGSERELTGEKFFNIKSLAWLPDQNGLLLTASRIPNKAFRIWQVSTASGDARPLTNDSETYAALSLNKAGNILVATQIKEDFHLKLYETKVASNPPRVLANASTVAFAPNGKIIFSSVMTGNRDIWVINPDGSEQRQLTNHAGDDSSGIVSPDNNFIFFASNRTGATHVWRMNADGSNQRQITTNDGGFPLAVSADRKWLYYHSAMEKTLLRVSTDGGAEEQALKKGNLNFAISPDGSMAAVAERQGEENVLKTVSLADGKTTATFNIPDPKAYVTEIMWSQNTKYLAYTLADSEFQNNTLWFQFFEEKMPRRIADLGDQEVFEESGVALSPNGESIAVVQGGWPHDAVLITGLK